MTPTPLDPARLAQSVISVPPLARAADFSIDREGNRRILEHLTAGGVTIALYGGNANFYNIGVAELGRIMDVLEAVAPSGTWLIPSIGADYGKAREQVALLKERGTPTAMLLPLAFPAAPAGVATGIRRLAEAFRPLIAYVKFDNYVSARDLAALVADGAVCAIKYAIVRENPAEDAFLAELVEHVDPRIVISGIGERPVIPHLTRFGLAGFTSGSVCIAPARSRAILHALKAGRVEEAERLRKAFLPLEDLRDAHSPLRVLHAAVRLAGIAQTGPLYPFLSDIEDAGVLAAIERAAKALLAENNALVPAA